MNALVRFGFRFVAVTAFLAVAFLAFLAWPRFDPASEPPKPVRIALGMTLRDFIAQNAMRIGEREPHGFAIDADRLGDWMPVIFDDHWIELTASDGSQSFTLPAGRTLHVSQTAGRIEGLAFRPFDFPKPLGELVSYVDALTARLRADGWRPSFPDDTPRSVADFDGNGKALFGEHISRNGSVLQMNIRDYGLAPRSESWIIDPFAPCREETRIYLLQVTLDAKDTPGYDELIYPRRIFVNGDKEQQLPLRIWIEDPDWSPAAAGMVPVPPERRPPYDWSGWEMPGR